MGNTNTHKETTTTQKTKKPRINKIKKENTTTHNMKQT